MAKIAILKERQVGREIIFVHPKLFTLVTQEDNTYKSYFE